MRTCAGGNAKPVDKVRAPVGGTDVDENGWSRAALREVETEHNNRTETCKDDNVNKTSVIGEHEHLQVVEARAGAGDQAESVAALLNVGQSRGEHHAGGGGLRAGHWEADGCGGEEGAAAGGALVVSEGQSGRVGGEEDEGLDLEGLGHGAGSRRLEQQRDARIVRSTGTNLVDSGLHKLVLRQVEEILSGEAREEGEWEVAERTVRCFGVDCNARRVLDCRLVHVIDQASHVSGIAQQHVQHSVLSHSDSRAKGSDQKSSKLHCVRCLVKL